MEGSPKRRDYIAKPLRRNIAQPSVKLKHLKITLAKKFTGISVHQTISRYGVPFLHIWKPISRSEGVQGMEFLPCFHIIATITNEQNAGIQSAPKNKGDSVLFQLHSFHGKVLAEELHFTDQCDNSTYYDLISRMAQDKLQLCHGIDDEIDKDKFINFIQTCDLPLLQKFRSIFLIEQLVGKILIRSRLCKFVIYDDESLEGKVNDLNGLKCCEECYAFHPSQGISNSLDKCEFNAGVDQNVGCNETEPQNIFYKVFSQTSIFDTESLAVIQKVNEVPNFTQNIKKGTEVKQQLEHIDTVYGCDSYNTPVKNEPIGQPDVLDNNLTHKSSTEAEYMNSNTLANPNHVYQNVYNHEANEILGETFDDNNPYLPPCLDIEAAGESGTFYVGSEQCDTDVVMDNNFSSSCEANSEFEHVICKQKMKKQKRVHADIKTGTCEPQYKLLLKERIKRRKAGLQKKENIVKEKQPKKRERRQKRERKLKQEELTGKKEFRRTCLICLYEFQSECNYNTDQVRHQQAFEDMEQSLACPLCQQR